MNAHEQLGRAIELAVIAHQGQKRRSGESYIYHPIRVMMQCRNLQDMIIAILHDVVEDTDYSLGDVRRILELNEELTDDLDCMTSRPHEYYLDYIRRLSTSLRARRIKKIDIHDNMKSAKPKRQLLYQQALLILN